MRTFFAVLAIVLLSIVSGRAYPHHSYTAFDMKKEMQLSGVVVEVQYTNPHAWIFMEIRNVRGNKETWAIEAGGPNILMRQGWMKNTVKVGDQIKVLIHPMRDANRKGGSLMGIVMTDGRSIGEKF